MKLVQYLNGVNTGGFLKVANSMMDQGLVQFGLLTALNAACWKR